MSQETIVYTINDVMEILQFSRVAILRFIKRGQLKAALIGNQYRIKKEHLDEFINSKMKG